MKFERVSNWCELSDCGRYSVTSSQIHGEYWFQARRLPTPQDPLKELLATCRDVFDARSVCAKHAQKAAA